MALKYRHLADTIVRQHDDLDGFQALLARLSWADLFAAPGATLPYLLGGLPRDFFGSEFFLANIIGVALPLIWSLFVSELLVRSLAFYGMTALLRTAGVGDHRIITYGTATIFALLPFYAPAFGAVAAAPFLLAAFLRTLESGRLDRLSMAVFVLFPIVAPAYVTIPYVAFLFLTVIAVLPFYRSKVRSAALGVGLFGLSILIVDWRVFYASLFGPITHRATQGSAARSINWSLFAGFEDFILEEISHVSTGKSWVLGIVFASALIMLASGWRRIDERRRWLMAWLVGAIIVAAVVARVWHPFEVHVLGALFDGWSRFQMERVRWVEPTVIYFLFALALTVLADLIDWGRTRRWLAPALVVILFSAQGWIAVSMQRFIAAPSSLTVREFYAPESMSEIKDVIDGSDGDLVVSVAIHPAVAIANGMDSADGYFSAYPLEYKHRFRELIAPALEAMTPKNRAYFDSWGSRAYVFQPDLPLRASYSGPSGCGERDLIVNPAAYEDLNVTHVISSCLLTNAEEVGLKLVLETGSDDELGPIWLYEVK